MSDAEMVRAVYAAMGYETRPGATGSYAIVEVWAGSWKPLDPLNKDADAMALLHWCAEEPRDWAPELEWQRGQARCAIYADNGKHEAIGRGTDPAAVRRAIVTAVWKALAGENE